jgi:hypothetical protein
MPNWVYSFIEVEDKHMPLLEKIVGRGGLCRHYIPMPADIAKTMSPNRIITEEEYAERVANGTTSETLDKRFGPVHYNTQAQVDDFMQRYGATDWYGWANANWGTKWGDCEHEIVHNKGKVLLRFETAWSPIADAVLEAFFADVEDGSYIWEEEQGFGEEYVFSEGIGSMVREWDELRWDRVDDQK